MTEMNPQIINWIRANSFITWLAFWVGWFFLSPQTMLPGSVAVIVGLVWYKERALTLVSLSASWLGFIFYLAIAGGLSHLPDQVNLWVCISSIFALIILGMRFPLFGFFLFGLFGGLLGMRGGYYPYYYRRRRW